MGRTRTAGLVAALTAVAVVAAACGPPPDEGQGEVAPDDPDALAFRWAVTGADGPTHEAVAELWNEQNPDQQVELVLLPPEADDQRTQLFQDQVTGAGRFDVLGLDVIWTGEFAEAGLIESLEEFRDEIEDVSIDGSIESAQWDGELWALPYSTNFALLYYRTDLVDEPPETWDELYETVQEIQQEEDIDGYVGQGDSYEGLVVNYLELFWSAGGELFDEDQTESRFLEGDAAERATEFMTDAYSDEVYAPSFNTDVEDDARGAFQAGDAIFMRNWPYAYPLLLGEEPDDPSEVEDDFDIAPLPTFDGEGTISALGGLNNAVSTLSDNPEVAKEFVVWAATDEEVQGILAEMQPPPTMASLYEDYADVVPEEMHPIYEVLEEVEPDARPRPPVPGYNALSLTIQDELHPVYSAGDDPGPALEAIDAAAEAALVEGVDPAQAAEEEDDG